MKRQGNNSRVKGRIRVEENLDLFLGLQVNFEHLLEEHKESTLCVQLFAYFRFPNEVHSRGHGVHNSYHN